MLVQKLKKIRHDSLGFNLACCVLKAFYFFDLYFDQLSNWFPIEWHFIYIYLQLSFIDKYILIH